MFAFKFVKNVSYIYFDIKSTTGHNGIDMETARREKRDKTSIINRNNCKSLRERERMRIRWKEMATFQQIKETSSVSLFKPHQLCNALVLSVDVHRSHNAAKLNVKNIEKQNNAILQCFSFKSVVLNDII